MLKIERAGHMPTAGTKQSAFALQLRAVRTIHLRLLPIRDRGLRDRLPELPGDVLRHDTYFLDRGSQLLA